MTKPTIRPMFSLPDKKDIGTQATAIIPTVSTGPITPIPPALIRPFFTARMPLPPSVNAAYKIGYVANHPRIIASPELEQFKVEAMKELARSSQSFTDSRVLEAVRNKRIKTPIGVRLQVYFLSEWKRDLDGPIKFAIDAAFDFIGLNDNQVVDIHAEKLVDAVDPRVEIEIRALPR